MLPRQLATVSAIVAPQVVSLLDPCTPKDASPLTGWADHRPDALHVVVKQPQLRLRASALPVFQRLPSR